MTKQFNALLEGTTNNISILANSCAFIYENFKDFNWVGFYLFDNNELILGPFQGRVACTNIPLNKGVCGKSATERKTILVNNVHEFKGHIACDSCSNSEIVIPIILNNKLFGVLDIDSPSLNRFKEEDKIILESLVDILTKYLK